MTWLRVAPVSRRRLRAWLRDCLITLLALAAAGGAWAQSLPFRCWTIADGLAQSVANTLLEDSRGFLWIGTASGLSRFDGQEFVNFDVEHGLPSARVYALFEDHEGVLWAGTDRGVGRFANGRWLAPFADSPVGEVRVVALAEHISAVGERRLVIGTRGAGLFVAENGASPTAIAESPPVISSLASVEGFLWVGTAKGLYRLTGDRLEAPKDLSDDNPDDDADFMNSAIQALGLDHEAGRLLIAGASGYDMSTQSLEWRQRIEAEEGRLTAVTSGPSGRLWFGTSHQGLLRVEGSRVDRFDRSNGLPVDGIRALARHSDGGLWIGTYGGGICRLNDESFALFTEDHGLPNNQVLGLAEGARGELWVSMLEGGIARFDGQSFESFGSQKGLLSLAASHLAVDSSGTLWAATLRGGLHRFRGARNSFEPVDLRTSAPPSIFHIMIDLDETLWLSTWGLGLIRFDPESGEVRRVKSSDGLVSERIFSSSLAIDGRIWLATPEGVQVLDPNTWSVSSFLPEQNPPGRVRAAVHDAGGRTFLATDRGVARWDGERFTSWGRDEGLASNDLFFIALDSHSQLWLGSERGLDRWQLNEAGELTQLRHFGVAEGFIGVETNQNAVLEDSRGILWFGTRGLARFDPNEESPPASPPRLHLDRVELFDGTPLAVGGDRLEIDWEDDDLIFKLIGIDFAAPEAVHYRYRLLGHNDEWSPPSSSRTAVFPRLSTGRYTFEAAASRRGEWSEPVQLTLEIKPPFWATWWFRALLVAILGLLLLAYVSHRVRRARQRRLELEDAVQQRTSELVTAKQEAEAANEAKSEFLSNMSHELRTPLTGVVSAAELLAKTSLDLKQENLVETIETSGRVLLSVINDILDQSRIEALGLMVDAREFSPVACFKECLSVIRHSAEAKGLELIDDVGKRVPERAIGDPVRLRQVLLNLLSNAIKFTDRGRISASLQAGEERGDRVQLCFAVRDTGIGIPAAVQKRIFEPFQQADTSSSRAYGGTGLGLSICDRLVTVMGGALSVESDVGSGAVFRFDIDVEKSRESTEEKAVEAPLPEFIAGLIVLLVEDNPLSQMITRSQLESLGLRPHVASNGREAVDKAAELDVDVIFMDGQMPEVDGYVATAMIRSTDKGHDVIIIGLTAHATSEARNRCLAAGMDDYLAKPVNVRELAERLGHWFPPTPRIE